MQYTSNNIFSSLGQQSPSKFHSITQEVKDFGLSMVKRLQQILSSLSLSQQTSQKISQNVTKAQEFFKQNKEVVLGVTFIAALYIARERRTQTIRNFKSRHIHSLTSNPNSPLKRSGSNKKQQASSETILENRQLHLKTKLKKPSNPKLNYLKAFISEAEQQEEEYIRSDQEDKDNPDLSTSTRRTESMVSDIEPLKKKKRKNLEPILDLVEEEDQTQDRVFFEMFRTYRES